MSLFLILILFCVILLQADDSSTTRLEAERVRAEQPLPPTINDLQPGLQDLGIKLEAAGVPRHWLDDNLNSRFFELYTGLPGRFDTMAEHQVQRGERDHDWYMHYFGVDKKSELGKDFLEENYTTLQKAEAKHGVPLEVVLGVLGMETNFAREKHRGNYNVFSCLVSQYLLMPKRQNFALRNLVALYNFSQKTGRTQDYFVGSFAGASGWGQFIPTSLDSYFIDAGGNAENTDIYSVDDNIFSIENYLWQNGLNGQNAADSAAVAKAVYSYNHNNSYVQAVIYIADRLKEYRQKQDE